MKRRFSVRELAIACAALPLLFGAQGGGCGKSKSADGGTAKPECPSSASCVQIDGGRVPPGSSAGATNSPVELDSALLTMLVFSLRMARLIFPSPAL